MAAESRRATPGKVKYRSANGRRSNSDSIFSMPWLRDDASVYTRECQSIIIRYTFGETAGHIITTAMAAEAMRSAVSRPSLFQGSAAFLSAVAAFLMACTLMDISSGAYILLLMMKAQWMAREHELLRCRVGIGSDAITCSMPNRNYNLKQDVKF